MKDRSDRPERSEGPGAPLGQFVSLSQAARWLGISKGTLSDLSRQHQLYAPAVRGMPGGTGIGAGIVRYHRGQLELIRAVMLDGLDVDEALTRWALARIRLCEAAKEGAQ